MIRILAILMLAVPVFAQDEYRRLPILRIDFGKVIIVSTLNMEVSGCVAFGDLFSSSKWQRRDHKDDQWTDIQGTEREGEVCALDPSDVGQYRLVGVVNVDGETGKFASDNILTVEGEGEKEETAVKASSWGFIKSQ